MVVVGARKSPPLTRVGWFVLLGCCVEVFGVLDLVSAVELVYADALVFGGVRVAEEFGVVGVVGWVRRAPFACHLFPQGRPYFSAQSGP